MSEMITYTGKPFDPVHPKTERIDIADIAHALSLLCRGNRHLRTFYSVAQHSINCAREAEARGYSRKVQLGCLLHDASEAYLSDVTRPVKAELPQYLLLEAPVQEAIWNKWLESPLTEEERKQVFAIDDALLAAELQQLMDPAIVETRPQLSSRPQLDFVAFSHYEGEFLALFHKLRGCVL